MNSISNLRRMIVFKPNRFRGLLVFAASLLVLLLWLCGTLRSAHSAKSLDGALSEAGREPDAGGQEGNGAGVGNVIFVHPDGSGLNHWSAARIFWQGPDGSLQWDQLPYMAVYRGHLSDQLAATSNGGATAHAFGFKVQGPDSFGRDRGRPIRALSGYPGSILREAASGGHPVGVVNDGDVNGEPGTGAFLAETDNRGQVQEQALQILGGRPGFDGGTAHDIRDGEADPVVVLGGGERYFLPNDAPVCGRQITPDCAVHIDPVTGAGPARTDGRNLIREAVEDGWTVVRTRGEFERLADRLEARPRYAPKVLGLFAAGDTFNDETEEVLIRKGLVRSPADPPPPEGPKAGRLLCWGSAAGTAGFNPPSAAEMTAVALRILDRRTRLYEKKPFILVTEIESTDNFAERNNAIGTLRALRRADAAIGVARAFADRGGRRQEPIAGFDSLVLTAADSDAGGMQVLALRPPALESIYNPIECEKQPETDRRSVCRRSGGIVTATAANPQVSAFRESAVAVDGIEGQGTAPFLAGPDALQAERPFADRDRSGLSSYGGGPVSAAPLPFAIAWAGVPDFAGGILARAQGLNARRLRTDFYERFDNTDVYRLMYATVFGRFLPKAAGEPAPDRREARKP